jgi:peptide/nickel transport system substrate-binding protein
VREALALNKMPLYRENEDKGYIAGIYNMHITPTDVFINMALDDPVWREVVQDIRFRQALAYAIDREEIIDSVYFGFADVSNIGINEYNPEMANALLDEMGMDERDADGFRLGPDGETFTIDFIVSSGLWADLVPVTELVVEFWNDVGLKTTMQGVDTGLWWNSAFANEVEATVINTQTPIWGMIPKADWWIYWGPPWVTWWYSGGEEGEEPPEEFKEFLVNLNSLYKAPVEDGPAVAQAVLDEIGEKLIYFVHIQNVKQPMIYSAKMGNIDDNPDALAIAYNFSAEQFFFKE